MKLSMYRADLRQDTEILKILQGHLEDLIAMA